MGNFRLQVGGEEGTDSDILKGGEKLQKAFYLQNIQIAYELTVLIMKNKKCMVY